MNLRPSPHAFALCLGLLPGLALAAHASDLGTAGTFRSLGGVSCPATAENHCTPPPVDPSLPKRQQVRAHVARALALMDLLRVGDATTALDEALKLDPDDVQALTLRGRMALSDGDGERAQIDIDHALSLAPDDPDLLATHGSMASGLCECGQGLEDLGRALKAQPNNVDALFLRAMLYLSVNDTARAFADLTSLLGVAPDDLRARMMRAKLQLTRKDYALAAFDAGKVIAVQPANTDALLTRAKAHLGAGDDARALQSYTDLLDGAQASKALMVPEFREAMLERARLYTKLNRIADAKRDLDAVIEQGGQKAVLHLQLFLRRNGFSNMDISGARSPAFDTALMTCFSTPVCGPDMLR